MLIYTDGGRRKGRGAYAYVLVDAPQSSIDKDYDGRTSGQIFAYGHGMVEPFINSAQAEVFAAFKALEVATSMTPYTELTVVSDSTYVVGGVRNPFRMAKNNSNYHDLWMSIQKLILFSAVESFHVKGHDKQTFNSLCDWMCGMTLDYQEDQDSLRRRVDRAIILMNTSKAWRNSFVRTRR